MKVGHGPAGRGRPVGGVAARVDPVSIDPADLAPAGHYLALRLGFAAPTVEVNRLPPAWVDHYTRRGFMLMDPVMRWLYENEGCVRWSAIEHPDPQGILDLAGSHGLVFGAAVAYRDPEGRRSFGSFARTDREFADEEMALLLAHVRARHLALVPPRNLTAAEIEALRLVKAGQRLKQIAHELGVTEGAVKQRLKNARVKLSAKTGAEAISRAAFFGLI
ncbi:LuxR family transcriptional regulator [Rubellimicrobium roseum]|uniref:LuxR family transcriptional regulator n=2 Tax=Rubellimicrobium roseum TaxID=687525 RepID=A0A5C4NJZ7_9RHOB|nr:LuxR family transcriptional regulator [Rubellimicrobium roseum]